jgi:hypothetical protein
MRLIPLSAKIVKRKKENCDLNNVGSGHSVTYQLCTKKDLHPDLAKYRCHKLLNRKFSYQSRSITVLGLETQGPESHNITPSNSNTMQPQLSLDLVSCY